MNTAPKTVSFWLKFDDITTTTWWADWRQIIWQVGSEEWVWQLRANTWSSNVWVINWNNKNTTFDTSWHNICLTLDNWTITLYKDWVQEAQQTSTTITSSWNLYIWWNTYWYNGTHKRALRWKMCDVIFEDKIWSVAEINAYYNQTKWNFTNATTTIPSTLLWQTYTGSAWRSSSDSDYNWSYQNTWAKGNHIGIWYSWAWFDMCWWHAGTWQGSYYYYRPHILYYYRDASWTNSWWHIDWSTYSNRYYSAPENIWLTSNWIYEKSDWTELIISVTMSCSYWTKSWYFKITSSTITWYDSFDTSWYNEISIQPLTTLWVWIDSSYQYDYPNMTFPSSN